jgi:hypothetical protein
MLSFYQVIMLGIVVGLLIALLYVRALVANFKWIMVRLLSFAAIGPYQMTWCRIQKRANDLVLHTKAYITLCWASWWACSSPCSTCAPSSPTSSGSYYPSPRMMHTK